MENWESWDSKKMKQKSIVETQIEEYRQRLTTELTAPPVEEEQETPDADYFQDMQPDYKKGKKVRFSFVYEVNLISFHILYL